MDVTELKEVHDMLYIQCWVHARCEEEEEAGPSSCRSEQREVFSPRKSLRTEMVLRDQIQQEVYSV